MVVSDFAGSWRKKRRKEEKGKKKEKRKRGKEEKRENREERNIPTPPTTTRTKNLNPPSSAIQHIPQTTQHNTKKSVHLHAIPAAAADDDLVEQGVRLERQETMLGVVQRQAVEGDARHVAALQGCEEA